MQNPFYISKRIKKQIFSAGVCVVFGCLIFAPFFSASADGISGQTVIQLVNKERLAAGISALSENSQLSKAAQDKVEDMIKNDYFAHTSPKGISPWYWFEKNGYDYKYAGENLAINFTNAESQEKAWMASPSHRKNILNPNYREIGVAVASGRVDGETSIITVQLFGALSGAIVKSEEAKPIQQEATAPDMTPVKNQETININSDMPANIFKLPENLKISAVQPEKIIAENSACQNGLCYSNEINSFLGLKNNVSEGAAWLVVIMILSLSIITNTIMLSQKDKHNPFIAVNTVVLLLVLTSLVFWKI
jgi:hypothetical protein